MQKVRLEREEMARHIHDEARQNMADGMSRQWAYMRACDTVTAVFECEEPDQQYGVVTIEPASTTIVETATRRYWLHEHTITVGTDAPVTGWTVQYQPLNPRTGQPWQARRSTLGHDREIQFETRGPMPTNSGIRPLVVNNAFRQTVIGDRVAGVQEQGVAGLYDRTFFFYSSKELALSVIK